MTNLSKQDWQYFSIFVIPYTLYLTICEGIEPQDRQAPPDTFFRTTDLCRSGCFGFANNALSSSSLSCGIFSGSITGFKVYDMYDFLSLPVWRGVIVVLANVSNSS